MRAEIARNNGQFTLPLNAGSDIDVEEVKFDSDLGVVMRLSLNSDDPAVPPGVWVRTDRLRESSFEVIKLDAQRNVIEVGPEFEPSDLLSQDNSDVNEFAGGEYMQDEYASARKGGKSRKGRFAGRRRGGRGIWNCLGGVRQIINQKDSCPGNELAMGELGGQARFAPPLLKSKCGYRPSSLPPEELPLYSVCSSRGKSFCGKVRCGHVTIKTCKNCSKPWATGRFRVGGGRYEIVNSAKAFLGPAKGCLVPQRSVGETELIEQALRAAGLATTPSSGPTVSEERDGSADAQNADDPDSNSVNQDDGEAAPESPQQPRDLDAPYSPPARAAAPASNSSQQPPLTLSENVDDANEPKDFFDRLFDAD
jgi:hypothetical protein